MKKALTVLFLMAASLLAVNAQTVVPEGKRLVKEGETIFKPYGYLQLQGGGAYTLGEADFSDLTSPAAALSLGYNFSKVFGLRLNFTGWQAKGGWPAYAQSYKWKYVQGGIDAVLDLSNLLCGWNPTRTFDFYAFLGAGANYSWDNDEVKTLNTHGYPLEYLWEDNQILPLGRGGLGVNIRLSDYVALNLEANANGTTDKWNSKKADNPDWQFNALAGLVFKFGKGYEKTEPVFEDIPVVVPVKPQPKPQPKPIVKPEPKRVNVFFLRNSTEIRNSEIGGLEDLVAYMNKYPKTTVNLTGYADKGTGNAEINSRLSEGRAAVVNQYLLEQGISQDRIYSEFFGDTVQPFAENDQNRVTICIAEEK